MDPTRTPAGGGAAPDAQIPAVSIVTDLMFDARAELDQTALLAALTAAYGGEDALATKQLVDADMLDPRQEMQISPSMPFRRRGERRLMIIDEAVPVPGLDPKRPPVEATLPLDLRAHREALITVCQALPVRLGRVFVLGGWGDAVLVARSARDLRAICLLPWVLDPQVDVDGKRRAGRLSQPEFEAKVMAYEKRLEELDDAAILARLSGPTFERRGELLVVDTLQADGAWAPKDALTMELQLAAIDRFSLLPGAPSQPAAPPAPRPTAPTPAAAPAIETQAAPKGPALRTAEHGGQVVLVFPEGRFDLDVAAALGKRDWDGVVRTGDPLTGAQRDRLHRDGGAFIAPLEFLSEVFVDGKPLTKAAFEAEAQALAGGVRSLPVHFPRFGPVTLLDVPGAGRFVTSAASDHAALAGLVRA